MKARQRLPRYVHGFRDRHGAGRYYFRRAGFPSATLPGLPWSQGFMDAYARAMAGERAALDVGASRTLPGTVAALTVAYFNSAAFAALAPSTRATYRNIIERFRVDHGDKRVALLQREHIDAMLTKKAATPSAANNFLRMVRMLLQFAVGQGLRRDEPTTGIKPFKIKGDGFHTWTEDEIAAFEARHPVGTKARLALALLLYTAQRRGDVVGMGRQHVRGNALSVRQQKTGAALTIPVHSELRAALDAMPNDHLTFLVTEYGKPFTAAGFGGWFRGRCNEAGLPNCSAHGLRKAASRRLAEGGCTAHEIMAITGHKTLKEVTRYTAAADRTALAITAMAKTGKRTSSGKPE